MTILKKNMTTITALAVIMLSLLGLPAVASASVTYDLTTFAAINNTGTTSVSDGQFTFTGSNSASVNTINVDTYGITLDWSTASGDGSYGTINIAPTTGGKVFTISSVTVAVYRCSGGLGCTTIPVQDNQYTFAVKDGASNVLASYTVTNSNNDGQVVIDPSGYNDVFNYKTITFTPATVSAVHVDITGVAGHDGGYIGTATGVTGFVVANNPAAPSPPTVTNISPTSGPTAGGTSVTITGTDFISSGTTVTIGGAACTSPSVTSTTTLTCTTSAGSAGTASVLATTAGGTNAANTLFTYVAPVPTVTTQAASGISATLATGNGNITATGGANATTRGVIYYAYTNTDKIIGDAGVTNISENGNYGTGAFTESLTSLSVNSQYNARAYATNIGGTGYGSRVAFWTLANVPSAPTVNNATATTLDVTVNVNGNPAGTEFAIQETSTGNYVQAGGTLGVGQVWQTAATWGTRTVTGLTTGSSYTFQVKARNGGSTETAYGATATLSVGVGVASPTISEDNDSGAIAISGGTPWYKITGITGGTLYSDAGFTTPVANGGFIATAGTTTNVYFRPTANFNGAAGFSVQGSSSAFDAGLTANIATSTITVTPIADTPSVASPTINEDTDSGAIAITRNAADGAETSHYKITGITGGTLYSDSGYTTQINNGDFIASAGATTNVYFRPTANRNSTSGGNGSFTVQASKSNLDAGLGGSTATSTITLTPVADTPSVASPTINEDTDSGAIAITRNAADGAETSHYKITGITGGTLYSDAGFTTPVANGSFIASGGATTNVYFRPTANRNSTTGGNGSFIVQASSSNADAGLGGSTATSTITLTPVADTPSITPASTTPATQTSSGLVVSRNVADGTEVTYFKITNIANGTLYQNDGATAIVAGSFISYAQANAGLKFTPGGASNGSFDLQASTSNADASLGGSVVTAIITVGVGVASPTINEDTDSGAIAISGITAWYKITGITGGTLYRNAGFTTPIANGNFITTAGATTNVYFRPTANFNGAAGFSVQGSTTSADGGLTANTAISTITVTPIADTPSITPASTTPATQTSSGLVVSRNVADGTEVTYFKITNIANGTLYQNDGAMAIAAGSFISYAQANAGLKFTPSGASNGSFDLQASTSNANAGLGGSVVTASITVVPTATTASSVTATGFSANWNAVTGATGYRLDVATDPGFTSLVSGFNNLDVGNVITKAVTGLAPFTTYHCRVRAYDSGGAGGSSNTITVTTLTGGITAILVNPDTPASICAALDGAGIRLSADGGGTWSAATGPTANSRIKGLVMHPTTRTSLFAASYGSGLFKSTTSGDTWTACDNTGLSGAALNAVSLAIDPAGKLYAGTEAGIFTSPDCAAWSALNSGLTVDAATPPVTLAIDPAVPANLYAGLDGAGVFRSVNSGGTWANNGTQPINQNIRALAIHPATTTTLYAGSYGAGVFISTNSGVDWSPCANTGLTNLNLVSLTIDATGKLYAGSEAGVFVSADGCGTWAAISNGLP